MYLCVHRIAFYTSYEEAKKFTTFEEAENDFKDFQMLYQKEYAFLWTEIAFYLPIFREVPM